MKLLLEAKAPCLIEGEKEAKGLLSFLLLLQGCAVQDIAARLGLKEEEIKAYEDGILKHHGSLEEYLENIGIEDDEFRALSNYLGRPETSAGAVLVDEEGRYLIEHMALGHYSLPKGHVEKADKDLFDTARREVKEELNLEFELIPGFEKIIRYSPYEGIRKDVHFYLGRVKDKSPLTTQKEEVADAYWLKPEDAYRCLSHNSDRAVLEAAHRFLFRLKK